MSDSNTKTKQFLFTALIGFLFILPVVVFIIRGSSTRAVPDSKANIGDAKDDTGLSLLEVNPGYEKSAVPSVPPVKEQKVDVKQETKPEVKEEAPKAEEKEEAKEADPEPEEEKVAELVIKSNSIIGTKETDSKIKFEYLIENTGKKIAEDVEWEWFFDKDKDSACKDDIKELEPGDTEKITCEYSFEENGSYDTLLEIDSEDKIKETNESNNSKKVTVKIDEKEAPDLVIDGYSFDPYPPEKDSVVKMRIGIRNKGSVAAEKFEWEWWPTKSTSACEEEINTLASNSTKYVTCEYTYSTCDKFKTKMVIDTGDDIDELDEDNNEYEEEVEVKCD